MEIKRIWKEPDGLKRNLILVPLMFVFLPLSFAQGAGNSPAGTGERVYSGESFTEETDGGARFRQRLHWPEDENALRYEAVIERLENGAGLESWKEIDRIKTEKNFVELSLQPARYRYSVLVYNFLGQVEHTMGPSAFRVIPAAEPPSISSGNPGGVNKSGYRELKLKGKNIFPESTVYLFSDKRNEERLRPETYAADDEGKWAVLTFNKDVLKDDTYTVYIENPGGLSDTKKFTLKSGVDWILVTAWSPLLYPRGYLSEAHYNDFYPAGIEERFTRIVTKGAWGGLGIEGVLGFNWLYTDWGNETFVNTLLPSFFANVMVQIRLNDSFELRTRAGIGLGLITLTFLHDDERLNSEAFLSLIPMTDFGASCVWKIAPALYNLHLELGAEYILFLSPDDPKPGFIRCFVGIGFGW